jgi:hypothetical protein
VSELKLQKGQTILGRPIFSDADLPKEHVGNLGGFNMTEDRPKLIAMLRGIETTRLCAYWVYIGGKLSARCEPSYEGMVSKNELG